jgi:hypothetical protein
MKCTSRDSRSSLAKAIGHALRLRRALARAAASLRAAVERVGVLVVNFGGDLEALGLGEAGDGGTLGVEPEPRAALLASAECCGRARTNGQSRTPFASLKPSLGSLAALRQR